MGKAPSKHKKYKKPPIVEAVIEIRFSESLTQQQLENLIQKQKAKFSIQKMEEIQVKLTSKEEKKLPQTETKKEFIGFKLTSLADSSDVVMVKKNAISVSRFPPYDGWPTLLENLKKHYEWYTGKRFKTLTRIGVRYINRIDIPSEDDKIELEDYFKIYPKVPTKFPDMGIFVVQTALKIDEDRLLKINLQNTEPPLLKHASMIFDLDVSQQINLPVSNNQLYEVLAMIRDSKDAFFEDLLTAKCKKLFS